MGSYRCATTISYKSIVRKGDCWSLPVKQGANPNDQLLNKDMILVPCNADYAKLIESAVGTQCDLRAEYRLFVDEKPNILIKVELMDYPPQIADKIAEQD